MHCDHLLTVTGLPHEPRPAGKFISPPISFGLVLFLHYRTQQCASFETHMAWYVTEVLQFARQVQLLHLAPSSIIIHYVRWETQFSPIFVNFKCICQLLVQNPGFKHLMRTCSLQLWLLLSGQNTIKQIWTSNFICWDFLNLTFQLWLIVAAAAWDQHTKSEVYMPAR